MDFDEYQKLSVRSDVFQGVGVVENAKEAAMMAKILGLVGEAGETAEKFKKIIRDKDGVMTDEERQEIAKELGDVLWYIALLAKYMGLSLSEIAEMNIEKLSSRQKRGKLRGSGDNR